MKTVVCRQDTCTKKTRARDGYCKLHKPMPWAVIATYYDGRCLVTYYGSERSARKNALWTRGAMTHNVVRIQSWKPVFKMPGDPKWYDNAQRFATEQGARASAHARFMVWTMPEDFAAHPSSDPVNEDM